MADSGSLTPRATAEFTVTGMHCSSCVALIEETLTDEPGVMSAAVTLEPGKATVDFDPSAITADRLQMLIVEAGYVATPAPAS